MLAGDAGKLCDLGFAPACLWDPTLPQQSAGMSRAATRVTFLYDILRERKPVSPAVAVRLGKLFGDGAGVWVRMQAAYDTWHAEREEDVSGIPTLRPRAA